MMTIEHCALWRLYCVKKKSCAVWRMFSPQGPPSLDLRDNDHFTVSSMEPQIHYFPPARSSLWPFRTVVAAPRPKLLSLPVYFQNHNDATNTARLLYESHGWLLRNKQVGAIPSCSLPRIKKLLEYFSKATIGRSLQIIIILQNWPLRSWQVSHQGWIWGIPHT